MKKGFMSLSLAAAMVVVTAGQAFAFSALEYLDEKRSERTARCRDSGETFVPEPFAKGASLVLPDGKAATDISVLSFDGEGLAVVIFRDGTVYRADVVPGCGFAWHRVETSAK